jgi:hypothetical protein
MSKEINENTAKKDNQEKNNTYNKQKEMIQQALFQEYKKLE